MNRQVTGAIVALTLIIWMVPQAQAKDMRGRVGVGLEQSVAGVSGLALRYWLGESLGAQAVIGGEILQTGQDGDKDAALHSRVAASVGVLVNVGRSLHANIGVGARAVLGFQSNLVDVEGTSGGDENTLQLGIEVPIMAEFFLSDSFSFSVATGVRLLLPPTVGDKPILVPPSSTFTQGASDVLVGVGAGSILGSLGAIYYF